MPRRRRPASTSRPASPQARCDDVVFALQAGSIDVRVYRGLSGRAPVVEWLDGLADRKARARVVARIARLASGLFGDCRSLGSGLHELRVDTGPGYRVYFAVLGSTVLLLLCGGDKGSQANDIRRAHAYRKDHENRRA